MGESQWRRCAYELCPRSEELIEIKRGHRKKQFHDDACRQAQHRLLAAQNVYDDLRQTWSAFLPETQTFVEVLLAQHGEIWARRATAAISTTCPDLPVLGQ